MRNRFVTTISVAASIVALMIGSTSVSGQAPAGARISPRFFGQNAWMPERIGDTNPDGDLEELLCGTDRVCDAADAAVDGAVKASGVKLMRYGGSDVDQFYNEDLLVSPVQYLTMVDNMRANGIVPLLQVPYFNGAYTSVQAADLVEYINICGSYDAGGTRLYYLDVIDFHSYPFPTTDPDTLQKFPQTRAEVIAYPQAGFQDSVTDLKKRVDRCNRNRPNTSKLKMAVTEINVEYREQLDPSLSAQSFLAGQFWADVMNVGMKHGLEFVAFWSVKEGGLPPFPQLGYIADNGDKLSPYYHYQMMAKHFRGVYAAGTVNSANVANVKAFGAKDSDQIVVMLLNQNLETTGPLNYTVRLDTASVVASNALEVNIDAGMPSEHIGTITGESTVMLVFNANGSLRKSYVYDSSNEETGPHIYP